MLVAYGLTSDGPRELIDYRIVRSESQGTWEAFLANLACRGLTGATLRLITTDGHTGLHAALQLVYPRVPRQTCWVHVLRNVAQRLRVRERDACLALARRIYQARTRPAAERALQQWCEAWRRTAPHAVATLLRDWDALLAFYAVPTIDWRRVRTTNAIERAFREIRRRTRPMTCFTNLASCGRIRGYPGVQSAPSQPPTLMGNYTKLLTLPFGICSTCGRLRGLSWPRQPGQGFGHRFAVHPEPSCDGGGPEPQLLE